MSWELLGQTKFLAFITLDSQFCRETAPILKPTPYCLTVFHFHYPVVYFEELHLHFQHQLPSSASPGNLRLYLNDRELPFDHPIGLSVKQTAVDLVLKVDLNFCLKNGFQTVKNSWKKAYEIVNPKMHSNYVTKIINKEGQLSLYNQYKKGFSNELHLQNKYEGSFMMVKGIYGSLTLERKFQIEKYPKMLDICLGLFQLREEQLLDKSLVILSFNVQICYQTSSKVFLDQCNYNDGYCYLVLQQTNKENVQ